MNRKPKTADPGQMDRQDALACCERIVERLQAAAPDIRQAQDWFGVQQVDDELLAEVLATAQQALGRAQMTAQDAAYLLREGDGSRQEHVRAQVRGRMDRRKATDNHHPKED